jgi:general nucleoside transport system permease protein
MTNRLNFKIEKRPALSRVDRMLALILALAISLGASAVLIALAGANLEEAFKAMFGGAFGGWRPTSETLVKATPLIFTGLAAAVAFRGRVWNIGAEGQLIVGAMAAFWASSIFKSLPPVAQLPLIILFAFLGGVVYGLIAGSLKVWFKVDEIISTVLLNYIAINILSFLLTDTWRDPKSFYQQSALIPEAVHLPILISNSRLSVGFILAVFAAVIIYFILQKTTLGYEIRAIGLNPVAARFQGIVVSKTILLIMLISGGLAGLAGGVDLFSVQYRLRLDLSVGYGFTGIIVAMLAGLNPLGVVPAAIFFGALINGSTRMQITTGIPSAVVSAIQGIVLLTLLATTIITNYRVRRINRDH